MNRRTRRRRIAFALAFVLVLCLAIFFSHKWWLTNWARALDVSEPPHQADFAMVLGGGTDSRPFMAAAMYRHGYVRQVLVPQIRLSPEALDGIVPGESELIRQVLQKRGVPDRDIILLPSEVNSTFDEAVALSQFLNDRDQATVAIITTDFHTRRARSVVRRVLGPERSAQVSFVGIPMDGADTDSWWKSESGFVTYLNETAKTLYYSIRY